MTKHIIAAALAATLATGCATVHDPITGEDRQELTPAGQLIVGMVLVGGLLAAASALQDDGPSTSYVTTYSDGSQSRTDVYDR